MRKLVVLIFVALGVLLVTPAVASASTPTLKSLAKAVKALQKTEKSQAAAITSLKNTVASQASKITSLQGSVGSLTNQLAGFTTAITDLQNTLKGDADVLALEPYVKVYRTTTLNGVSGPNIVLKGCNLQIKSTTGESDTSGLGNLIVGWNDEPGGSLPSPFRTGSNNLVCGDENNFTGSGGLLAAS